MKRIIMIAMFLSTLLTFCACQTTGDPQETLSNTGTEEIAKETESKTEAETIDPRILYGWHWTNDSYTYINGDATPWIGDEGEYRVFLKYFKNFTIIILRTHTKSLIELYEHAAQWYK